jgi:hypothetical protein
MRLTGHYKDWKVIRDVLLRPDEGVYLVIAEIPEPTDDFRYALLYVDEAGTEQHGDFATLADADAGFEQDLKEDLELQRDLENGLDWQAILEKRGWRWPGT